ASVQPSGRCGQHRADQRLTGGRWTVYCRTQLSTVLVICLSGMDTPPSRSSLSEEAYAEIRQALLRGDLAPGQRVSEPELALKFNTSRSPIREALMRLEHDGF